MKQKQYLDFKNLLKYLNLIASLIVIIGSTSLIFLGLKYRNKIDRMIFGSNSTSYERPKSPFEVYKNEYRLNKPERFSGREMDRIWARKLMEGGYILHFRHAEREKWIDVEKYDSLESDVQENGINGTRYAEKDYFAKAVCLNSRGKVQARAIGEHLNNISFPIGYIISSPSCRARQTAELAFGGYSNLDRNLVHAGPYSENIDQRTDILRKLYLKLPLIEGKNTIVSAHNGVIMPQMFENSNDLPKMVELEEGGFYVMSIKNNKLYLEHEFHRFRSFIRHFYKR